jgi:hypothetical protein
MKRKYGAISQSVLTETVVDTSEYETKQYEQTRLEEIITVARDAAEAAKQARDAAFANLHETIYKRVAEGQLTPEEAEEIIDRIWNLHQDPDAVWKDYEVRVKARMQDKFFHEKLDEFPAHWYDWFWDNYPRRAIEKGIEDIEKKGMTAEEALKDVQDILKWGAINQTIEVVKLNVLLIPLLSMIPGGLAGLGYETAAAAFTATVTIGGIAYSTEVLVTDIINGKWENIGWDVFFEVCSFLPVFGAVANRFTAFRNVVAQFRQFNNLIATKLGRNAQKLLLMARGGFTALQNEAPALAQMERDARYLSDIFNRSMNIPFQYQAAFTNLARESIAALPANLRASFTQMMAGLRNSLPRFSPEALLGEGETAFDYTALADLEAEETLAIEAETAAPLAIEAEPTQQLAIPDEPWGDFDPNPWEEGPNNGYRSLPATEPAEQIPPRPPGERYDDPYRSVWQPQSTEIETIVVTEEDIGFGERLMGMKPGDTQISKRFKAAGWRNPTGEEISTRIDQRERVLDQRAMKEMQTIVQRDGGLTIQNISKVIDSPRKFFILQQKAMESAGSGLRTIFNAAQDRGLLAGVSTANEVVGTGMLNVTKAVSSTAFNSLPVGVQSDIAEFTSTSYNFIRSFRVWG